MRHTVVGLVLIAACAAPPRAPISNTTSSAGTVRKPDVGSVKLDDFGTIAIEDGMLIVIDRYSSSDGRIQQLSVKRDLSATKASWLPGPDGKPVGEVERAAVEFHDERAVVATWFDRLWSMAPTGRREFARENFDRAYTWAIVMRRGTSIRVLEGGASANDEPDDMVIVGVLDTKQMQF